MINSAIQIRHPSDLPPKTNKNMLRLFGHHLCPYVERVRLVLAHKGIPYENIEVDLMQRPKWFYAIHRGAVPVLETPDGKRYSESKLLMELIDTTMTGGRPLLERDPFVRTERALLMTYLDDLASNLFLTMLTKDPQK